MNAAREMNFSDCKWSSVTQFRLHIQVRKVSPVPIPPVRAAMKKAIAAAAVRRRFARMRQDLQASRFRPGFWDFRAARTARVGTVLAFGEPSYQSNCISEMEW